MTAAHPPLHASPLSPFSAPPAHARHAQASESNIRELVALFYARVHADELLGPVFEQALSGRWDAHLARIADFWSDVLLGTKRFQGNLQRTHALLGALEPAHFNRWLYLFCDTVEGCFEANVARRLMEPALRIAHSLQISRYGWAFAVPAEQREWLARLAPRPPRAHV